jgi:NTE family protein
LRNRTGSANAIRAEIPESSHLPDELDPRPLFAIFEGGGAKGVAHIGAMRAVEERAFSYVGVAGASAGAVIAALAAVGYRSQDIFSTTSRQNNLLDEYRSSPQNMLGPWKWWAFKNARRCLQAAVLSGPLAAAVAAIAGSAYHGVIVSAVYGWLLSGGIFLAAGLYGWFWQGWFDSREVGELVNWALKRRLQTLHRESGQPGDEFTPDRVLFRHLQPEKFPGLVCELKIIATDVDDGKLVLFDSAETPEVEIGRAVAASIAIPIAFRPVSIPYAPGTENNRLLDGGLVSNLPAWTMIADKLAWERSNPAKGRVPVAAFRLDDPKPTKKNRNRSRGFGYLRNIGRTAIFGGQEITQEFLEDLFLVTLRPALPVLRFDAAWHEVVEAVQAGYRDADQALNDRFVLLPRQAAAALGGVALLAEQAINALREADGHPPLPPMRACVFSPFGKQSLRIVQCWNMDQDPDDRLSLDLRAPGAPEAYHAKEDKVISVNQPRSDRRPYMTRYERALIPPTLQTAICIPIFSTVEEWAKTQTERNQPLGVVCIDSTEDVGQYALHDSVRLRLRVASVACARLLREDPKEPQ